MESREENVIIKNVSWSEINTKACEEASLCDMSGWHELD
jgi:hypothetical protein